MNIYHIEILFLRRKSVDSIYYIGEKNSNIRIIRAVSTNIVFASDCGERSVERKVRPPFDRYLDALR